MNCIEIEFIPKFGLVFRKIDANKRSNVHEVKIETLMGMSLEDIEHCLSFNSLMELDGLKDLFSDYLWGGGGTVKPRKKRDDPR